MALNNVCIMGRLTKDPELRRTGNGIACANFTLAVDRDFSGKDGQEKETDFIDFVAWRKTAEFVSKYFSKGRMMVVNGRIEVRNWTDKEGNKRKSMEIVAENCYFGDSKKEDGNGSGYNSYGAAGDYAPAPGGYAPAPGGYAPAPGGYAPAPGGYAPAPAGYAPAPAGYAPAPNGNVPAGYAAPAGYAPAPGGYPPAAPAAGAPAASNDFAELSDFDAPLPF